MITYPPTETSYYINSIKYLPISTTRKSTDLQKYLPISMTKLKSKYIVVQLILSYYHFTIKEPNL